MKGSEMRTRSEEIVNRLIAGGHTVRLLAEDDAASQALNEYIDRTYFREQDGLTTLVRRCHWASYGEQKQCFGDLLSHGSFRHGQKDVILAFVPIFGPDETIETTPQAILGLMDEFLEIESFIIHNSASSAAIIQRRYGVMDLVATI